MADVDLRTHRGEHPRLGAVDVVPFVPIEGVTMADCVALARKVAAEVAARFQLPVYLYEEASSNPSRKNLEDIRRGEFEGLAAKMATAGWTPDFGPAAPHASAGAAVSTVSPYVYAPAIDDQRVRELIDAMQARRIDAIAFTSKLQIERLVSQQPAALVKRALTKTKIAAVGPIVAEAIRNAGFEVASSPEHSWFMKPLVVALSETLQAKKDKDHSGLA